MTQQDEIFDILYAAADTVVFVDGHARYDIEQVSTIARDTLVKRGTDPMNAERLAKIFAQGVDYAQNHPQPRQFDYDEIQRRFHSLLERGGLDEYQCRVSESAIMDGIRWYDSQPM